MKAAVFEAYRGPLEVRTVPDPACPADGVVLKVEACGVCRSDHHGWSGVDPDVALPHVPGHEFAGTVIEVGPACRGFRVGDRVTAPFILACGDCPDCRGGRAHRLQSSVCGGFLRLGRLRGDAGRAARRFQPGEAPRCSWASPRPPPWAAASPPPSAAWWTARHLKPGEWLAIHGCGGVGLSAVMIGAGAGRADPGHRHQ